MTNLAGHDMGSVLDAFHGVTDDQPTCFIAYTIKGYGLPFAGHKDNHAGLMNPDQMALFQQQMAVTAGAEWEPFTGLDLPPEQLAEFLSRVPLAGGGERRHRPPPIAVPAELAVPRGTRLSTQEAFGRILGALAAEDSALAGHIVTTSPDVTVSTNLGGWVNRRGIFDRAERADIFREEKVVSAQRWAMAPHGQHIELGIAESNLFLTLAALGLAGPLFGSRLLPIGTLYDPFIKRGLDALNYALYQDARFILVATPLGITLAPEGGAHQSVIEPLIGLAQPGLISFEPAYADELAVLLRWSLAEIQRDEGSRCISACRRDRSRSRSGPSIRHPAKRSWPAPTGCASRPPAPNWLSPIAVRWRRRRSPRTRRSARMFRGPGCWPITSPSRLSSRLADCAGGRRRGNAPSGC